MNTVRGLAEVVLWVHDLGRSFQFYSEALGLPVLTPPGTTAGVVLQAGRGTDLPQTLVLLPLPPQAPPYGQPRPLHHLALEIDPAQFDHVRTRLEGLGYQVAEGQHPFLPARTLALTDPDGNAVELLCRT